MKTPTVPIRIHDYYTNSFFSLFISQDTDSTKIVMELLGFAVNTKYLPATYATLQKHLPTVLHSKCFNDRNYAFDKEVKNTEIGHLFEHILLEYLCQLKLAQGVKDPVHNGLTEWDWDKDPAGVFHINIDAGYQDQAIFKIALKNSTKLLVGIMQTPRLEPFTGNLPQPSANNI